MLGIHYDEVRGESAYEPDLPRVLDELHAQGPARRERGRAGRRARRREDADPAAHARTARRCTRRATSPPPSTAGTTYHFDALAVRRRSRPGAALPPAVQAAREDGPRLGRARASTCRSAWCAIGGKKTSTRLGNVVLMRDVFKIAEDEVRAMIAEVNPDAAARRRSTRSRARSASARSCSRTSPRSATRTSTSISTRRCRSSGDSGPYLQYSHARCASIARKAGERDRPTRCDGHRLRARLAHDAEWAVARRLLELPRRRRPRRRRVRAARDLRTTCSSSPASSRAGTRSATATPRCACCATTPRPAARGSRWPCRRRCARAWAARHRRAHRLPARRSFEAEVGEHLIRKPAYEHVNVDRPFAEVVRQAPGLDEPGAGSSTSDKLRGQDPAATRACTLTAQHQPRALHQPVQHQQE